MSTFCRAWILVIVPFLLASLVTSLSSVANISADTGDTVRLPCTSRTTPSSWQHQQEPSTTLYYVWIEGTIAPKYDKRFSVPLASRGNYTLMIVNVSIADSGLYYCVEFEEIDGLKGHLVRLAVTDGNVQDANISADTGDTVHLPCTNSITPSSWQHQTGPSTTLYYVWVEGLIMPKYSERFTVPLASRGNYTLMIVNVSIADSGLYYCVEETDRTDGHLVRLTVKDALKSTSTVSSMQPAVITVMIKENASNRWWLPLTHGFVGAVVGAIGLVLVLVLRRWLKIRLKRCNSQETELAIPLLQRTGHDPVVLRTMTVDGSIYGITAIDRELYVLHEGREFQVDVFDLSDGNNIQLRQFSVPRLAFHCNDMTSCTIHKCLYITDFRSQCIHRVDTGNDNYIRKWELEECRPHGLSVTNKHQLLVTCHMLPELRLYNTNGELQSRIFINAPNITSPFHAIQLSSGHFVVSHGNLITGSEDFENEKHGVFLFSDQGALMKSYFGSDARKLSTPRHLAVYEDKFIFVVDCFNSRIILLDSSLKYVRSVVTSDFIDPNPYRLCLDSSSNKLCVAYFRNPKVDVFPLSYIVWNCVML